MSRVRQAGTDAELLVRDIVRSYGFRCSTNGRALPGSPDLVHKRSRFAIFVHGCFWHAHRGCTRSTIPKTNRAFWKRKFADNQKRDRKKARALRLLRYRVLTVWECELEDPTMAARRIVRFLEETRLQRLLNGAPAAKDGKTYCVDYQFTSGTKHVRRRILAGRRVLGALSVPLDSRSSRYADPHAAFDHAALRRSTEDSRRTTETVFAADLFSGCGGLSLGARDAASALGFAYATRLAVDVDRAALQVFKDNFAPTEALVADIRSMIDGALGRAATPSEAAFVRHLGDLDVLLAGPPCQGFSDLNNHSRRFDQANWLYERVARVAELARPRFVLIENVPAAAQGLDHAVYDSIRALRRCGYEVASGVVDLGRLGVPQRRRRHVVVASLDHMTDLEAVIKRNEVPRLRTMWWATSDLRNEPSTSVFSTPSVLSPANRRRIERLKRLNVYDLPNRFRPECHRNGNHSYRSMYGRLRFDLPVQTITSGFGSPGQGRFIHPTEARTLTPHEAARLQFFPDTFTFEHVTHRTALASMIGNAAPSKLAYVFVLDYLAMRQLDRG